MTDICLTKEEIQIITGKVKYSAQARALNMMGIDHKLRPDGTVMVFRADMPNSKKSKRPALPDFSALNHVA